MVYRVIGLLVVFFIACASMAEEKSERTETLEVGLAAPDFSLQDAEDQTHALKEMQGTIVLLIMGNRKIRKEDDRWAEAFEKDFGERDDVVGYIVADMRSVPAFVPKGFIKRQLKKNQPPVTLLLDWGGKTHQAYHTTSEMPNLYVIDAEGKLVFQAKSNFDEKVYHDIKNTIERVREHQTKAQAEGEDE